MRTEEIKDNSTISSSVKGDNLEETKTHSDQLIQEYIKQECIENPLIEDENFAVEVKNGVVRLTGAVAYEPMKNEIINIAAEAKNVVNIIDELTISGV